MKKKTNFFKDVVNVFTPFELVFHIVLMFGLNYVYFYLISKNLPVSIGVGLVSLIFFFVCFAYKFRKLNNYQDQLNSLLKYVTNMTFFLQTGENILYSLRSTKPSLIDEVQKDVQKTIDLLEEDAVLNTEHFKKYDFPSLDQFHHNLAIKYDHGGDPKELFTSIQQNMMYELKKRDELYKKAKGFAMNVYLLLGLVASVTIILRFMVSNLWNIFLSFPIASTVILLAAQLFMLLNLYFLQKRVTDISVRI